jgi:hypothetical protein
MDKLCAVARILGIAVAIASAFVAIPNVAIILLLLGGVAALCNDIERTTRIMLATIVLILGAKTLEALPAVGVPLAAVFAALGTALVGASIVGITMMIITRVRTDWVK